MRQIIGKLASNWLGIGLAAGLWLALASIVWSQSPAGGGSGHGGGGGSDQSHSPASYYKGAKPSTPAAFLTVHAGKYLVTHSSEYEWVIMPLQMRVYGFDDSLKPMTPRTFASS